MMNLSLIRKQALISQQDMPHRCHAASVTADSEPQATMLARLAALSHGNTGWIIIANAPGRLCRHTLAAAGINPGRVIDAHHLSPHQLQTALASPAIAAVLYWHQQDETFLRQRQDSGRLFVIGPAVPACPLH